MRTSLMLLLLLGSSVLAGQQGWRLELSGEDFLRRGEANAEVFKGDVWLFNGAVGAAPINYAAGVRRSSDGAHWPLELQAVPWQSQSRASSVVFNGRLWKLGGEGGNIYSNDIWSSDDGVNWIEETPAAPWAGRGGHSTVEFDGKIWVMGGYSLQAPGHGAFNDIWSSPDGVNWTQEVAVAPWSPRSFHTTVVFDDLLWIISGGSGTRDVWSSPDGINWTLVTDSAAWPAVAGHTSVVYRGRMWVIGGLTFGNVVLNTAWSSTDGMDWKLETSDAPWGSRAKHMSVVFNNRIWIMGGSGDWQSRPDIWSYGLHFTPDALPSAIVKVPYTATIEAKEGDGPYTWSLAAGALPPGMSFDLSSTSATVPLTGAPAQVGTFAFTLRLEDQFTGDWAEQELTLKVNSQFNNKKQANASAIFPGAGCQAAPSQAGTGARGTSTAVLWLAWLAALTAATITLRHRTVVAASEHLP